MGGFRCTDCGHVMWSYFSPPLGAAAPRCPLCDGETARERRVPGRDRRHGSALRPRERRLEDERRSLGPAPT